MKKFSNIGSLLKKIYRAYSQEILERLEEKGFTDLRPSFLEILVFVSENDNSNIKNIGKSCGLKKQTMTSHLNELEIRGYIKRTIGSVDKREQRIELTSYGEKFKMNLIEVMNDFEKKIIQKLGEPELDRIEYHLENLYKEFIKAGEQQSLI